MQTSFQRLLNKQAGKRSAWEYPFAVAGVNITFMIMQMLDLDAGKSKISLIRSVKYVINSAHIHKMQKETLHPLGPSVCVGFCLS